MSNSVRLVTIGNIEIGIHYSWLLIFFLVAWTLAVGLFPAQVPGLDLGTYWAMGFAASLFLFVSVLIHELAHSFVAEALGMRVRGITLFIFGGVSNIAGEPTSARDELLISAVGPLSSAALGGLIWALLGVSGLGAGPVQSVLAYVAGINLLLAVFNLIPGFPLDGGRVLRAGAWWVTGSFRTATRIAAMAGHAVAFTFIVGGLYIAVTGAFLSGIWLVLIGWFLNSAAEASGRQIEERERVRGVRVGEMMNPYPLIVGPDASIADVVHDFILGRAVRALPVVEDHRLIGMLTLNEVRGLPRTRWEETPVRAVMTRIEGLQTVRPEDDLEHALGILATYDVNQLPVVKDGRMVGLLSRSNLIRFLQIREELGLPAEGEERRRAA